MLITKSQECFLCIPELVVWSLSISVAVDGIDAASTHDDVAKPDNKIMQGVPLGCLSLEACFTNYRSQCIKIVIIFYSSAYMFRVYNMRSMLMLPTLCK